MFASKSILIYKISYSRDCLTPYARCTFPSSVHRLRLILKTYLMEFMILCPPEWNSGACSFCLSVCPSVSVNLGQKTLTLAITFEPLEIYTSYQASLSNDTKVNDLVTSTGTFRLKIANVGLCCRRGHSCFSNTSADKEINKMTYSWIKKQRHNTFYVPGMEFGGI